MKIPIEIIVLFLTSGTISNINSHDRLKGPKPIFIRNDYNERLGYISSSDDETHKFKFYRNICDIILTKIEKNYRRYSIWFKKFVKISLHNKVNNYNKPEAKAVEKEYKSKLETLVNKFTEYEEQPKRYNNEYRPRRYNNEYEYRPRRNNNDDYNANNDNDNDIDNDNEYRPRRRRTRRRREPDLRRRRSRRNTNLY